MDGTGFRPLSLAGTLLYFLRLSCHARYAM